MIQCKSQYVEQMYHESGHIYGAPRIQQINYIRINAKEMTLKYIIQCKYANNWICLMQLYGLNQFVILVFGVWNHYMDRIEQNQ